MIIMWDGLGFFGFDDTKLDRLKGVPVTFKTKFSSAKAIILSLLALVVITYVILKEAWNLGKQKSQTVSLIQNEKFTYTAVDALSVFGGLWWYVDELFPLIRNYQIQ